MRKEYRVVVTEIRKSVYQFEAEDGWMMEKYGFGRNGGRSRDEGIDWELFIQGAGPPEYQLPTERLINVRQWECLLAPRGGSSPVQKLPG